MRTATRHSRWAIPTAVGAAGIAAVATLADGVLESGDLAAYDPVVTAGVVTARTPLLTAIAQAFTFTGSMVMVALYTLAVVAWLGLRRRQWRLAALVAGTMATSAALTVVLKLAFGRARPAAADVLGALDLTFAFPSGHTLNSTVFFGLLAALAVAHVRSRPGRAGVVAAWLAMVVGVAASRVYLGYHWLTDVLAGCGVGVVVLAAAALVARRLDVVPGPAGISPPAGRRWSPGPPRGAGRTSAAPPRPPA